MDANFDDFLEDMFGERSEPVQEGQQIVGQGPVDDDLYEWLFGERPEPVQEGQQFIDLDKQVPFPSDVPDEPWVEAIQDVKSELEFDGASAVFPTWWLRNPPIEINATMSYERESGCTSCRISSHRILRGRVPAETQVPA